MVKAGRHARHDGCLRSRGRGHLLLGRRRDPRAAADRRARRSPTTSATMRTNDRYLQVVLPLRNKFERVGDLVLTVDRTSISRQGRQRISGRCSMWPRSPCLAFALDRVRELGHAATASAGSASPSPSRPPICASPPPSRSTMITVFSEGAQSKGRALADSLGQRLDDIVNFGLQLDQIEGLDEVLDRISPPQLRTSARPASRSTAASSCTPIPPRSAATGASDPANHEYRADLTPANHPRAIAGRARRAQGHRLLAGAAQREELRRPVRRVEPVRLPVHAGRPGDAAGDARSRRQARSDWRDVAALDLVKPIFFLAVFVDHLALRLPAAVRQRDRAQARPAGELRRHAVHGLLSLLRPGADAGRPLRAAVRLAPADPVRPRS